jgi:hypothetical protein
MKSKLIFILCLFLWISIAYDQTQSYALQTKEKSELSIVMDSMYSETLLIKKGLETQTYPSNPLEKYKIIHTATPTDADVKTAEFREFANDYLKSIKEFYQETSGKNYTLMINACIRCHESYCPGPLKKINQLKLSH